LWLAVCFGYDTLDWKGTVAEVAFNRGHLQYNWALTRLERKKERKSNEDGSTAITFSPRQ
jgi:hypothetical protein